MWQVCKYRIMRIYVFLCGIILMVVPRDVVLRVAQSKWLRGLIRRYKGWRAVFRLMRNKDSFKLGQRSGCAKWRFLCGFDDIFTFHDENCSDVVSYNKHLDNWKLAKYGYAYPLHKESDADFSYLIKSAGGSMRFYADDNKERWINIVAKGLLPKNYAMDFVLVPHTIFVEQCQIAFGMQSLAERHRFVIEFNKRAYYQRISDWEFLPELASVDITFKQDQPLHVRFEMIENNFTLLLNSHVVLCVMDLVYKPTKAYAALIFWNGWPDRGGCKPMDFEIKDFKIETL